MPKAIIWDLDGVLIDSEKDHVTAEIATFKELGIDLTREIAKEYMGCSLKKYVQGIAERFGMKEKASEIMEKHQKILDKYYSEIFPMVPHVDRVLAELSGPYRMALATSAVRSSAEGALNHYDLMKFFEISVCGDEVTESKPDSEIFLKAAEELSLAPNECMVVEDSENGFRAAKDAGMKLIARKAGHNQNQDFSLADYVVEDLLDIIGLKDILCVYNSPKP